jgi:2-dehydropantoate 2-reductase
VRFVIVGAGAVGGVIGGRLAQHGHDVVLVARGAHGEALGRSGLRLQDPDGEVVLDLPVARTPAEVAWAAGDVAVLAVKSQDTIGALDALAAAAPPDLPVVCAQNGVHNEEEALRRFPAVHGLCVVLPATHLEPGVVRADTAPLTGILDVGRYPAGVDDVDRAVAGALAASTFASEPRPDVMRWKYAKLVMNLTNAVTALCGTGDDGGLARRARREGFAVLAAAGIDVASRDEEGARRALLDGNHWSGTRGGGSSWQSLHRGTGSIEADHLNGEIVLLGRRLGRPTPVNTVLQRLANEAARTGAPPGSRSVAEVTALVDAAEAQITA